MPTTLHLQHRVQTQATPTERSMQIAAMFGLSLDAQHEHTIIPPIELTLTPGEIVFITGVSGGGKSTLLRLIKDQLQQSTPIERSMGSGVSACRPAVIDADAMPALLDVALVDVFAQSEMGLQPSASPAGLDAACRWLSMAGLNDAAVMLRTPSQLSVGQRYRLQLAQAIAAAERNKAAWSVMLVDEFASSLDRTTAQALAASTRKWVRRSNICLVAATAHDDLLESLSPEVLIDFTPGGFCEVHRRGE